MVFFKKQESVTVLHLLLIKELQNLSSAEAHKAFEDKLPVSQRENRPYVGW